MRRFIRFLTDINFNKIPTTIQKEYQTKSSTDNLDTKEPEENPDIIPFVDVNKINSKFSQFDSEKLIKPKVKIAFCITNNKWSILYTKDEEKLIIVNIFYMILHMKDY